MSTEAKWTPGPWTNVDGVVTGVETREKFKDAKRRSWELYNAEICPNGCEEEYAANAHLIAAAPELYEALAKAQLILSELARPSSGNQSLLQAWAQCVEAELTARKALAKARGETP